MNSIEMRKTHLKNNKNALYKDLYIDGKPFQQSLKKMYPSEFSRGRYAEEFIPRIISKANNNSNSSDSKHFNMIVPIYGCQNNCCMYLFAEIEYTESQVKWLRIAQDSGYIGSKESEQEPLVWLNGFENLIFDKSDYDQVFN